MTVELLFWMSIILLVYIYSGYPFVAFCLAKITKKSFRVDESYLPKVSVILSVYNEEQVIEAKIDNFLALDYPSDRLELVVISDCCSDTTDALIRKAADSRIRLFIQTNRSGKTRNLNWGVREACGDILIFTDANSMFAGDAIKKIVRHFIDPQVSLVSGKSIYSDQEGRGTSGGVYRRYEDFIKKAESGLAGIVGADGAIYGMSKAMYSPLRPEHINDFIHTIQVVLAGKIALSDDQVICREKTNEQTGGELRRQTRIMAQSWLIFMSQILPLLRARKFLYIWQIVSHKFLRWLTVPILAAAFLSNLSLGNEGIQYIITLVSQMLFWLGVIVGSRAKRGMSKVLYLFILMHYAAVLGLIKYLSGNVYATWNPREN
jgi:cellulose synthase/poly-beta-1,6-N-acetylglucosamine synthase-like glycosyltransferase